MDLPFPIANSWPLFERRQRFDLGMLLDPANTSPAPCPIADVDRLTAAGIGLWRCDLSDNALIWTAGVYDLFGLPRDAAIERDETAAFYAGPSRVAMERLRAHAIQHRRGFTLDAEVVPASGPRRWMRLIAAPVVEGARVVRLHGIKQDVTSTYR